MLCVAAFMVKHHGVYSECMFCTDILVSRAAARVVHGHVLWHVWPCAAVPLYAGIGRSWSVVAVFPYDGLADDILSASAVEVADAAYATRLFLTRGAQVRAASSFDFVACTVVAVYMHSRVEHSSS